MIKVKKINMVWLYAFLMCVCLFVDLGYVLVRGGGAISKFLFHDVCDCGNDFFNCIPAIYNYGLGYWLISFYPPLAKLFFLVCGHIIGKNNVDLSLSIRNSLTDLRMNQSALFMYVLMMILTTIVIIYVGSYVYEDKRNACLLSFFSIGSYSVLFAIERGNIIYISFAFALFYCVFYNSHNAVLRELAFMSLAIAAGLKLYPAAFGIMLLADKRWKESFRTIVYGILALAIPTIILKLVGPECVKNSQSSIFSLVEWAKSLTFNLIGSISIGKAILVGGGLVCLLVGIIYIMFNSDENWVRLFLAGVVSLLLGVQFAYPYAWLFLLPSFLFFLKKNKIDALNIIYFMLFSFFNLPIPVFGERYSLTLSHVGRIKEITLFILILFVIFSQLVLIIKTKKGYTKAQLLEEV